MVKKDQKMSFCTYSLICWFHHFSYQKNHPNDFSRNKWNWLAGSCFFLTAFLILDLFGFSLVFFSRSRSVKDLKFGGVIFLDILQVRCYFSSRYFMKKPIFLPFLLIFIFFLKKIVIYASKFGTNIFIFWTSLFFTQKAV